MQNIQQTQDFFSPKNVTINVNPETRQREPFKVNLAHFLLEPVGVSAHGTGLPGAGAGGGAGDGAGVGAGAETGEGE